LAVAHHYHISLEVPLHLIVVRHGQTSWNAEGRIQGQIDTKLNPLGQAQAKALVARLSGEAWDALYVSDLLRARDTAAPLIEVMSGSPQDTPVVYEPRLREIAFGRWEGLTFRDLARREPGALRAFRTDVDAKPHGGESLGDVVARGRSLLAEVRQRHSGGTVLWVAHGGMLRLLTCHLLGLSLFHYGRFRLESTGISAFEISDGAGGGVVVSLWNDHRHTQDLPV
jgi:2,3-bisphosphoglycerate-dependent phosphoglycerate mutase